MKNSSGVLSFVLQQLILALVISTPIVSFAAEALDEWHWRNPLPTGNTLTRVVTLNGTFLAVGDGGTILTSSNGTNWSILNVGTEYSLTDVAFGSGIYMATGIGAASGSGGSTGILLTSSDAITWQVTERRSDSPGLNSIAYGNGTFVAVGDEGGIFTRTDDAIWVPQSSPTFETLYCVRNINGTFVALGYKGVILTSPDGIAWSKASVPWDAGGYIDVAYGNGRYLAIGRPNIDISTDLETWTNVGSASMLRSVSWGNSMFVAVGLDGEAYTSADGLKWTKRNTGIHNNLFSIAYSQGTFVAVGSGAILVSSTGADWLNLSSGVDSDLTDIVYHRGAFYSVTMEGVLVRSCDGVQFAAASSGLGSGLRALAQEGNTIVAVGDMGAITVSTNGTTWLKVGRPNMTANLSTVVTGKNVFVAGGDNGTLLTSTNATDWSLLDSQVDASIQDIAYGSDLFVAVAVRGQSSWILTSPDSLHWTAQSGGENVQLLGVGYGQGTFVAVGPSVIRNSTNGTDWLERSCPVETELKRVRFAQGSFVAVGQRGAILTSTNGADWVNRLSGTANYLYGVAYGNRSFVAVGVGGTILQSGALPATEPLAWPNYSLAKGGVFCRGQWAGWRNLGGSGFDRFEPLGGTRAIEQHQHHG